MRSTISRRDRPSCRTVVISLNTIPGFGSPGTSRMRPFRSSGIGEHSSWFVASRAGHRVLRDQEGMQFALRGALDLADPLAGQSELFGGLAERVGQAVLQAVPQGQDGALPG